MGHLLQLRLQNLSREPGSVTSLPTTRGINQSVPFKPSHYPWPPSWPWALRKHHGKYQQDSVPASRWTRRFAVWTTTTVETGANWFPSWTWHRNKTINFSHRLCLPGPPRPNTGVKLVLQFTRLSVLIDFSVRSDWLLCCRVKQKAECFLASGGLPVFIGRQT